MKYNFNTYNEKDSESINQPMLLCEHWRDNGGYGHFSIRPVYVGVNEKNMNDIKFYNDYATTAILANLTINCQYGTTISTSVNGHTNKPYAFNCEYQYSNIGIDKLDASTMRIKFLSKINKQYQSICNEEGYPESFTEYVFYLARILGIKMLISRYTDDTFNMMSKGEFRNWIQDNLNK